MPEPLLKIDSLNVGFRTAHGFVDAVSGVDLSLMPGETVALVGESGSGKTVTALSIAKLISGDAGATISGKIFFNGEDLLAMPEDRLQDFRGRRISYVFQEPATALNPVFTVQYQIDESLRLHRAKGHDVKSLLLSVGIRDPERVARSYPHQLSGGQQQRIMLAMALACDPDLLIADEPTTALDVTVQAQILELLQRIKQERGLTLLLITHNLAIASRMADRICVMYAGQQVESGPTRDLLSRPAHPYTRALLEAVPRLRGGTSELRGIPGQISSGLHGHGEGCRFHTRCPLARPKCASSNPALAAVAQDRQSRCFFWPEVLGA